MEILSYQSQPSSYQEYDPESAVVAHTLVVLIHARDARLHVEHIGSTAVPDCRGKGYIDLLVTYPVGLLDATRQALDALGFQRQSGRDPFPEDRPMRVGLIDHRGRHYPVHAHVVAADAPEAGALLRFRDRLRADPALRAAYEAEKRRILSAGIVDPTDYANAKTEFITRSLPPR